MDINNFAQKFLNFEKNFIQSEDWWMWDIVRFEVSCVLFYPSKKPIPQQTTPSKSIFHHLILLFRFLKVFMKSYDFIIFSCSRFQNEDGCQYDPNILDIYPKVRKSALCIDSFFSTGNYEYPVVFDYVLKIRNKYLSRYKCKISFPDYILKGLEAEFGQKIEADYIESLLMRFQSDKAHYIRLFRWLKPQVVFLVQNGVQKGLFAAARQCQIPVVELQHGLVDFSHLVYSYPKGIDTEYLSLPSYFFVYSEFWKNRINFPVKEIVVTGNTMAAQVETSPKIYDLTIIATDIYMSELFVFLDGLFDRKYDGKICLKLHPNQLEEVDFIREKYKHCPNVEIIYTEIPVKKIIAQSWAVLVVQSTCVYEALDAGVKVYILKKLDYMIHQDVFDHPLICLINSADDYFSNRDKAGEGMIQEKFFEPFDSFKVDLFFRNVLLSVNK